jgi:hypothetical protein
VTSSCWAVVIDEADVRRDGQVVLTGELFTDLRSSSEAAWERVGQWVEDHWDRHVNAGVDEAHEFRAMPGSRADAIAAYFEEIGGRSVVREVALPGGVADVVYVAVLDEADVTYGDTTTLEGELEITLHTDAAAGWARIHEWVEEHHRRHPPRVAHVDLDPAVPTDRGQAADDYLATLGSRAVVRPLRVPSGP